MGLFTKVFGTYSQRELKSIYPIVDKITALEEEVNASGAYLRESERWYGEAEELNLSEMYENELSYIGLIDSYLRELWPSSEMVAAKAQ